VSPTDLSKPPRRPAADVPSITGLRLSPYGTDASLVDISTTGLLVECKMRLKVGSPVQVLFEGGFSPNSAACRVARCEVAAMGRDGILRYHIGIGFNSPIELDEAPVNPTSTEWAPSIPSMPPPVPAAAPFVARNRW
jgi:hypothetical protein